jgi:hypothetical protein
MEGLGEARDSIWAQPCWQLLGAQLQPRHLANPGLCRPPLCFSQHVPVGVKTGRVLKPRRQQQGEIAGTAADVEESAGAIERQLAR